MSVRILQGDCRDVMATLPEASVDAIVCDPPYELTAGKKGGSGAASVNIESPYGRARIGTGNGAGGFMGMRWDSTGVAFDPETWRQALRVLKPGGHLLAFGGTRTYHRMACAIEDAGFEIRDQVGWLYGSGFPKSHNGEWGGTALKPAWEPIVVARKPLIGTVEANWREHGTGALNIDACRVPTAENLNGGAYAEEGGRSKSQSLHGGTGMNVAGKTVGTVFVQPTGRWPANVIHDGSDEVMAAFPQAPGAFAPVRGVEPSEKTADVFGDFAGRAPSDRRDGGGSAARFFYTAKASRYDRNDGTYDLPAVCLNMSGGRTANTSKGDGGEAREVRTRGNHHPTVKPTDLMRYLCRLVTPPGGTVLDPFMGSGSTLKAAELEGFDAIGIELDPAYIEIAKRRIASDAPLFAEVAA